MTWNTDSFGINVPPFFVVVVVVICAKDSLNFPGLTKENINVPYLRPSFECWKKMRKIIALKCRQV